MSQTYHCQLRASVRQTTTADDTVRHRISLTEILPADQMTELLRQGLRDAGFEEDDSGLFVLEDERGKTTVDLDQMEIATTRSEQQTLQTEAVSLGTGWSRSDAQKDAQQRLASARDAARQQLDAEAQRIQRQLSDALAQVDAERTELIHIVLQEVYAESLKQKARQMGDVVEISEGTTADGEYELVIKVET